MHTINVSEIFPSRQHETYLHTHQSLDGPGLESGHSQNFSYGGPHWLGLSQKFA